MGIEANKGEPVEIVFLQFLQPGHRVFDRQHQSQLLTGVRHHLQLLHQLRRQLTANDRQIDLAIGHAPAGAAGAVHLQLHRHIRVFLAEQANHPRHQIGARGLTRTHDQRAAFEVVQIIQGPAGLLALAEDPLGIAEQQMAGFGQLRLAATAIE